MLGRGVHRRTRCAPLALRSNSCGESVHEACALRRACHPAPCAPQAHPEGNPGERTSTRAIASLRCARPPFRGRKRLALRKPGRAQRWPEGLFGAPPLLAAPAAGRLRGGTRVEARVLRCLARRGCLNGALKARREFCGAPRNRPAAGLPLRTAKGSQTGGRLSFGYFSLAKQRTSTSAAGPRPGLRPQHKHAFQTSTPQLRQAQTERPKSTPVATKIIATTA